MLPNRFRRYGNVLIIAAVLALLIVILVNLVMGVDHGLGLLPTMPLAIIFMFTTNVLVYIMIYLIIFRISIWKMRRQCKEDQA